MKRVKYLPDGQIYIGGNYVVDSFEEFQETCDKAGVTNPLTKGKFGMYLPSKGEGDKGCGFRTINAEGHDGTPDCKVTDVFETIAQNEVNLLAARNTLVKEKAEIAYAKIPKSKRTADAYNKAYTYDQQIEALRDALNGDNTKLTAINAAFATIKTKIKE